MAVIIHVNSNTIRSNKRNGENKPPLTIRRGSKREYGHRIEVIGDSQIIYSPDKPLACGAKVWIKADDAFVVKEDIDA